MTVWHAYMPVYSISAVPGGSRDGVRAPGSKLYMVLSCWVCW